MISYKWKFEVSNVICCQMKTCDVRKGVVGDGEKEWDQEFWIGGGF